MIERARRSVALNGLAERIKVRRGDVRAWPRYQNRAVSMSPFL